MNMLIAAVLLGASFQTAPDALVGRYTLDRDAGDDPAAVAEAAARDVGRLQRGRVRARLQEVLTPTETLELHRDGAAYLVTGQDGRSLRVVPDGTEREQETPRGETAQVAATLDDGSLVIRIRAGRGGRTQVLTPTEDGLRVVITYAIPVSPEPVRVEFVYRRVDGSGHVSGEDPSAGSNLQRSVEVAQ